MRLHNRQIKASFWTDTDLIRELPLEGRLFYLGLIQIADDSGCLDDDVLSFKILLFPGDQDVTEDTLNSYRETLIRMGKLIPYVSEGKNCLYLKNFHKHQTIKNPAAPVVPLPPWVKWVTYESNRRNGKYEVENASEQAVSKPSEKCQKDVSEDCLTEVLQSSSNQEPRTRNQEPRTKNQEPAGADDVGQSIVEKWETTFGSGLSSLQLETMDYFNEKLDTQLLIKAIDITKEQVDAKKIKGSVFKYTAGILKNWLEKGIHNLDQLEEYEATARGDPDDEYIPPLEFFIPGG